MGSNISINKPMFFWDSLYKLVELKTFQEECHILFDGPYKDESEDSKASLVLNWLSQQGSMTLKSLEVNKKDYKVFLKALEDIFRTEANDTMTHFCFRNIKQNQGQSVDSFLNNLCLALLKCQYGTPSAHEQLKDQFIFGVTSCDVQDNLLKTIKKDNRIKNAFKEQGK